MLEKLVGNAGEPGIIKRPEGLQEHPVFKVITFPELKHGKPLYHLILSGENLQFLAKSFSEVRMMVGTSVNGTSFCLSYNPGRGLPKFFKEVSGIGYVAEMDMPIYEMPESFEIGVDNSKVFQRNEERFKQEVRDSGLIPVRMTGGVMEDSVIYFVKLELEEEKKESE